MNSISRKCSMRWLGWGWGLACGRGSHHWSRDNLGASPSSLTGRWRRNNTLDQGMGRPAVNSNSNSNSNSTGNWENRPRKGIRNGISDHRSRSHPITTSPAKTAETLPNYHRHHGPLSNFMRIEWGAGNAPDAAEITLRTNVQNSADLYSRTRI